MQYTKGAKDIKDVRDTPYDVRDTKDIKRMDRIRKEIVLGMVVLFAGCSSVGRHSDCYLTPDGKCNSVSLINSAKDSGKFYGYPLNGFEGKPIRSGENIQQIWVGPYEDKDGNYHEPSYVYSVIKKGTWIGEPAREIQD